MSPLVNTNRKIFLSMQFFLLLSIHHIARDFHFYPSGFSRFSVLATTTLLAPKFHSILYHFIFTFPLREVTLLFNLPQTAYYMQGKIYGSSNESRKQIFQIQIFSDNGNNVDEHGTIMHQYTNLSISFDHNNIFQMQKDNNMI